MKILHVIASIDPAGGGPIEGLLRQEQVTGGAAGLATRELVTLDLPDAPFFATLPVKGHGFGRPRTPRAARLRHPIRWLLDRYGYAPGMIDWIRENAGRFDAVIVHGLWNYSTFAAARALPGGKTPYFVFTHGMMDPWFRRHDPVKHRAKDLFWRFNEGRLLAGAAAVLFTSEEEKRLARTSFRGHDYRGDVVGYGAARPEAGGDDDAALVRGAVPGLGDRPYLLYLGRIHAKKGCDDMIRAFARVAALRPELRLVVAGPDQTGWQAELQALAAAEGVADRLLWPGPVYGAAKWAVLRQAEAFILSSHQENFGISVAEALGCGTPVLITDQVNIWQEIAAAEAGLVCGDNPDAVEGQLRQWFGMDAAARRAMGARAAALFAERFDVTNTAPALLHFIASRTDIDLAA